MASPKIGPHEEWAAARAELLVREEEHKRLSDELAQQRRELPWVRVEKDSDSHQRAVATRFYASESIQRSKRRASLVMSSGSRRVLVSNEIP
jgi:predicted dithiol-disulfide oxidoreductase (DUF899 family)